jgi:hypothetical protein
MDYDNPQFTAAVKRITNAPLEAIAAALHAIADGLQEQNAAVKEQARAYQDAQHAQRRVTAELKVPQSEKYKQETNTTKESFIKWGTLYIEVVGIIVVVAYTTVAAFQLNEMRKSTKASSEASRTAALALAENTRQFDMMFGEIQAQTFAQITAGNAAKEALIASNRAWLEIELAPPWRFDITNKHPATGNELLKQVTDLSFPLTVTSIGKTPAKKIEIHNVLEVLRKNQAPSLDYEFRHRRSVIAILFPGREFPLDATIPADASGQIDPTGIVAATIPDDMRKALERGDGYVAIFSRATYWDEFGGHWLHFCTPIQFSTTVQTYPTRNCTLYNDAGDGNEPK